MQSAFSRSTAGATLEALYGTPSAGAIAKEYDLKGMPSSFLVNRAGAASFKHTGFREKDREAFETEIRQLIAE